MKDDYDLSKLKKKLTKKRINSRNKGNTFERKICEIFNAYLNTTDFCRTPGSGAFATTHKLPEHLQVYGDLITPKQFKFLIECKFGYNNEGICSLFGKSNILNFIQKVKEEARKANKDFLLIFKQNREKILVIKQYNPSVFTYPSKTLLIPEGFNKGTTLSICELQELLELNKPDLQNPWFGGIFNSK